MKVKTNQGDVELTAEMVVRGMVFRDSDGTRFTVGVRVSSGTWEDAHDSTPRALLCWRDGFFLGCDPTIASRAACERYGIHGDAVTHGFARIPSGGALDLRNAANVRKGMLFRMGGHDVTAACDGQFALADDAPDAVFIGCHPALARREDCERLGIPARCEQFGEVVPLDAAAHGFARLRDGGAVDLRREIPTGAICFDAEGRRFTAHGLGLRAREGDRFLGLNAHYASPEDIKRLCCGAEETTTVTARGFAGVSPTGRVCTLAIGDHAEHEDLATGVKWSAGAERYLSNAKPREDFNASLRAAAAGVTVTSGFGNGFLFDGSAKGPRAACPNCGGDDATCRGSLAGLKACAAKGAQIGRAPAAIEWWHGSATLGHSQAHVLRDGEVYRWHGSATLGHSQAHVLRDGEVYRWQVTHLGLRIRDGVEPHTFDAHEAAGRILFAVHDATAGIEWLARMFGLLFAVHNATPAAKRAKQEAPLVALVSAVPDGLDPIGWRAAALAVCEKMTPQDWQDDQTGEWLQRCALGKESPDGRHPASIKVVAWTAYQRAISPAPKVERQRLTWKTRGPLLAVDRGDE